MAIQPSDLGTISKSIERYVDFIEPILDQKIVESCRDGVKKVSVLSEFYRRIPCPSEIKKVDILAEIQRRYYGWDVSYFNECSVDTGWESFSGLYFNPKGV